MKSTARCSNARTASDNIRRLRETLDSAEAVVIGAGAGLSVFAGFIYTGERFRRYFSDFADKYGFRDMYSGGFYPFPEPEEFWAYWSRYIFINRYTDAPKPVYDDLLALVQDRDYFVITTNVDHCFQKAGFDKKRLFYTQGDYGLFQCSAPCCQETFDNEDTIRRMMERQSAQRLYAALGRHLRGQEGWRLYLLAAEPEFEHYFGSRADKKRKLYNGRIQCNCYMYLPGQKKGGRK